MGNVQDNPVRHWLIAAWLIGLIFLPGCPWKEGIKAVDVSDRTETTIGDMTADEGSTIIGAINVGNGSWVLIALLAVLVVLVWRQRRRATQLVDIWVERNEHRFKSMSKAFAAWTKSSITVSAKEKGKGAARLLKRRVRAMRRKRRKEAGRDKKIRDDEGNVISQWDEQKAKGEQR